MHFLLLIIIIFILIYIVGQLEEVNNLKSKEVYTPLCKAQLEEMKAQLDEMRRFIEKTIERNA